jgi:arsenite methyltransferase
MSQVPSITDISVDALLEAITKAYTEVAQSPGKGYHFHTGLAALDRIGYNPALYATIPEENIASFAGTGNPFCLGPIRPGETVVDAGSGSGLDALIASGLVGPGGQVVGIDMTDTMLQKARKGAEAMGATHVSFRHGYVDELALPDEFADVLISNGVLNLTPDKAKTLAEWHRVLKPGGRLYVGDIVISKALPREALHDISLWTG